MIRKAFSIALDRNYITSFVLVGDTPLTTALPAMLSNSTKSTPDANPEEANHLFAEGLKQSGYTIETFPAITLSYFVNVPGFTELAEYMQKVWSETFSIPITLEGTEWNLFFSDLQQGNFQIGGCSFDGHMHDPIEFLTRFEQKNDFNFSKWTSSQFQDKLALIRKISEPIRRIELLKELEEILIEELPIIPVCTHTHFYVLSPKWTGIRFEPAGCIDFTKVCIPKLIQKLVFGFEKVSRFD